MLKILRVQNLLKNRVSEPSIYRQLPAPRLPAPKAQNIVNKAPNFLVMFINSSNNISRGCLRVSEPPGFRLLLTAPGSGSKTLIKNPWYHLLISLMSLFLGFIGSLEKRGRAPAGGDIRNKYRVGEFISGVHFALRSRTFKALFYAPKIGVKTLKPILKKSVNASEIWTKIIYNMNKY